MPWVQTLGLTYAAILGASGCLRGPSSGGYRSVRDLVRRGSAAQRLKVSVYAPVRLRVRWLAVVSVYAASVEERLRLADGRVSSYFLARPLRWCLLNAWQPARLPNNVRYKG